MQKYKLNRKIVICSAFYLMLLIEVIFILPGQVRGFIKLVASIKQLNVRISDFESDIKSQDSLRQDVSFIKKEIETIEGRFIPLSDSATVSVYISSTAKDYGIDVQEVVTGQPKLYKTIAEGNFFHLPVSMQGTASYHDLGKFIDVLENGPHFLQVRELFIKEATPYHLVKISFVALLKED